MKNFNSSSIHAISRSIRDIEGWFSRTDQVIFSIFLQMQESASGLFEIGVFQGKSSILIGKFKGHVEDFHVCDIFETKVDDELNRTEVENSYRNLSLVTFKNNFLKHHDFLPTIHICDSSVLVEKFESEEFRFIHIDGSHLYPYVDRDIDFAIKNLNQTEGIVAVDDFRASHTPAVAGALWSAVANGLVNLVAISEYKAYLGPTTTVFTPEIVKKVFIEAGLNASIEEILGKQVVRVRSDPVYDFKTKYFMIGEILPPIVTRNLKKFKMKLIAKS